MKTPEPKVTATVCSVCGLDWKAHKGANPTLEECVRLLKAARCPRFEQGFGRSAFEGLTRPDFLRFFRLFRYPLLELCR